MDRRKVGRRTSWRTPPRQVRPESNEPGVRPADNKTASFDLWLDHRLKEMYGAVVEEPLPKELSELVERLKQEAGGEDDDRNK